MAMEFTHILLNAQSADGFVRKNAEECLKQFQEQNPALFLLSLSGELASEEKTNLLRNGILEASAIFQSFKNSPRSQLLVPFTAHIIRFLDLIYMEKDMDGVVMKTAIGVLGDIADTLGSNAGSLIQQSLSSKDFLNKCLSSDDHLIKESAEWANLAISRAILV